MTTLDTQTWLRGEFPGLGLTDEDVSLLRGVDCDILAQGLIEIIEYPTNKVHLFFGSLSRKNLEVKCVWFGAIWDG
jgi:hypothetical protein